MTGLKDFQGADHLDQILELQKLVMEGTERLAAMAAAGVEIPYSTKSQIFGFNLPPRNLIGMLLRWRLIVEELRSADTEKCQQARERIIASRRVAQLEGFSGFDAVVAAMRIGMDRALKDHTEARLPSTHSNEAEPSSEAKDRSAAFQPKQRQERKAPVGPRYTLEEARLVSQELGIKTGAEYRKRWREDPRLYRNPHIAYQGEWKGWADYLGTTGRTRDFYPTLAEVVTAVKRLGIRTSKEYRDGYKSDPRLHSTPRLQYNDCWPGWPGFFDLVDKA